MLLRSVALNGSAQSSRARPSILHGSLCRLLVAAIILPFTSVWVSGQQPGQDDVIRVTTDLVVVPATVVDVRGRRVSGLKRENFVVRDDGQLTRLEHFSAGTDNVALAFLLDASGSARDYAQKQRDAALALFSRFGPGSEIAILRFSERAALAVPFTRDIAQARSGFQFPAIAEHHTAIFDAAATAIKLFELRPKKQTERRIVILTSDGLDTASNTRAADVIEHARAGGISFYVIQFPLFVPREGHLAPRSASKGFRELADKTGGQYFIAGGVESALDPNAQYDLTPVFKSIEDDLASQYLLGFYPRETARDGRQRRIEVNLTANFRKYRVRALRQEYTLAP